MMRGVRLDVRNHERDILPHADADRGELDRIVVVARRFFALRRLVHDPDLDVGFPAVRLRCLR